MNTVGFVDSEYILLLYYKMSLTYNRLSIAQLSFSEVHLSTVAVLIVIVLRSGQGCCCIIYSQLIKQS